MEKEMQRLNAEREGHQDGPCFAAHLFVVSVDISLKKSGCCVEFRS